ncbi:aldose-1-epimerase [Franconibacter daqui]|uniref:aldose-1-epimerase n=1 Tax=Franconibacter daqui TaxID=2047724 RepID=UPI002DBF820B|nr:aldose-1-epimerase [Franconibacter daqui]MEB5923224.1 aldose-1-epimerase [Franconibacter daqui]
MHKSGKTLVLNAGRYQAKIVTVGAGLAELTYLGRHLVVPHKPEEMPPAHMGKVLLPWPNRIAGGRYHYAGKTFTPAINDSESGSAIHGLLAWQNWQVAHQSAAEVTLTAFLPPTYGYPFMLACEVTWRLDAHAGLSACIATQNLGDEPAPYGAGAHPYLTCNLEKVDSCTVVIPAEQAFSVDAQRHPLHLVDAHELGLLFSTPRKIGATLVDHTFKTLANGKAWEVRLTSQRQAMSTFLRSDQPWLQIYTGDKLNRIGLAVEPMSCPPDAFNSGLDLLSLAPGQTHQLRFSIGGE